LILVAESNGGPTMLARINRILLFVDATTSTTPHFRLIAVNLNH
jgi:hypothetical protein